MIWLAAAAMAAPPAAAEVWTSAGVEARVSDPVGVGLTQNVRFGSGPARVNEVLTDLSGEVKLSDAWALQAAYRFGSKLDDDARLFAHRGTFDTKAGWDVGRLGLDWRERYQVRLPESLA